MKEHFSLFLFILIIIFAFGSASNARQMSISSSESISSFEVGRVGSFELPNNSLTYNSEMLATKSVKKVSEIDRNSRIFQGCTKIILGVSIFLGGQDLFTQANNYTTNEYTGIWKIFGLVGGVVGELFGAASTFWGLSDLFFYQTETERYYKELEKVSDLKYRESLAVEYLKVKTIEANKDGKQNDIWNLFGLIPKPDNSIEKEYKDYLEYRHEENGSSPDRVGKIGHFLNLPQHTS